MRNSYLIMFILIMVISFVVATGCVNTVAAENRPVDGKLLQFENAYSGIEYAVNKINDGDQELPNDESECCTYSLKSNDGCDVSVTIEYVNEKTYKVSSLYTDAKGVTTTIANYIKIDENNMIGKG